MKKSQIKMAETVTVLVIFIFVTFIGFVFYSNYEQTQLRQIENRFAEYASLETVQLISYLPELRCPTTEMSKGCIDKLKLESFKEKSEDEMEDFILYYDDLIGNSKITLDVIYPEDEDSPYEISDNLNENSSQIYMTQVHVSLYDPTDSSYSYAVLEVEHASVYG
ncbi:MAG: hypothetical protein ACOCP4_03945 [Candidatus Woesearchaeota archaeon]